MNDEMATDFKELFTTVLPYTFKNFIILTTIISEYMLHGDLKEYLMNDDVRLTMRDKLSICHQV